MIRLTAIIHEEFVQLQGAGAGVQIGECFSLNRECIKMEFDFVKNVNGTHNIMIRQGGYYGGPVWRMIIKTKECLFGYVPLYLPYNDGKFELAKGTKYHFCIRDDGKKRLVIINGQAAINATSDNNWQHRSNSGLVLVKMDGNSQDLVTDFKITLLGKELTQRTASVNPSIYPTPCPTKCHSVSYPTICPSTFNQTLSTNSTQ